MILLLESDLLEQPPSTTTQKVYPADAWEPKPVLQLPVLSQRAYLHPLGISQHLSMCPSFKSPTIHTTYPEDRQTIAVTGLSYTTRLGIEADEATSWSAWQPHQVRAYAFPRMLGINKHFLLSLLCKAIHILLHMLLVYSICISDPFGMWLIRSLFPIFFSGATYSPPSPLELHYADTTSSVYPDRPIRPLPKRRIRSRLSSEAAHSILHPPAATLSKPLFQFPYNGSTDQQNGSSARAYPSEIEASSLRGQRTGDGEIDSYHFRGAEHGSDDGDGVGMARRYQEQRQRPGSVNNIPRNGYMLPRSDAAKYMKAHIPQSTASSGDSVDGYDSFENTNNKKKRKIPTSGSLGSHQTSLSTDMAQMGISSTRDVDVAHLESDSGVGHYYGTGNSAVPAISSGTGISGAGRGRYGRAGTRYHSGRSPLGVSINGSNTQQAGRSFHHRRENTLGINPGSKGTQSLRLCICLVF